MISNSNARGRLNSLLLPPNFPREFDAHIYFTDSTRDIALKLREESLIEFEGDTVFVGEMIDYLVGPHPQFMFEINFPKSCFSEVVLWLLRAKTPLSILIHEQTGYDLADHTQGAMWIGQSLDLKLDVFA